MLLKNENDASLWADFSTHYNLTPEQLDLFKRYCALLLTMNAQFNLTAITNVSRIVADHFEDSLAVKDSYDFSHVGMFADIGSGGGFPGLPLKIIYPDISLMLIEVSAKKRDFLALVAEKLGLSGVFISDLDWRTFLRKTDYPIDLFCARASLQPEELVRMFKPDSPYKEASLLYWASRHWEPSSVVAPFVQQKRCYLIEEKQRCSILFSKKAKQD